MITDDAVYLDGQLCPGVRGTSSDGNKAPGAFAWIGVRDLDDDDLSRLQQAVGVDPVFLSKAHRSLQRPGLDVCGDTVAIAMTTGHYNAEDTSIDVEEVLLVLGRDFIVTVGARVTPPTEPGADADLAGGPLAAFRLVLDLVIDDYLTLLDHLDREIKQVERAVFSSDRANPVEQIYRLRRLLMDFEQATAPLVDEPLERLVRRRLPAWIADDPYSANIGEQALREIDRHFRHIDNRVRGRRELLDGILNANLTQVGIRQNEDMRKISAWVATAAAPTLVAGIYGMNFEGMPELSWTYGYPAALGLMVTLATSVHVLFRRKGWL
ncbi:magnesium and cobalt transport protein CorA [Nocardia altamirensis]|uniref:magnesium and cobalt transport protein CorA n=1 Tax=Nocardia altamirensis TaxID=472158 RepID=UPI001435459A|nr:magnesium and cobalt transport protein CorA [Nocardia altamirensis]